MDDEDARPETDREALVRIVGEPVVEATPAPWGFANRTDLVTTASGRRLAVQRLASRRAARSRLRIATLLDGRLRAAGIPVPRLVAGDATAIPPYAITEVVAGAPGNTLLDDPTDAVALGTEMGRLATRIAAVDVTGIRLPSAWADPAGLAQLVGGWLETAGPLLDAPTAAEAGRLIARIPDALGGRPAVLAHGDFAPVNVVVRARAVVALLDWEDARLADPLFDVAWWSWVVWHHHPDRYRAAAPALFETAGIVLDAPNVKRIRILVAARLLEAIATTPAHGARTPRERWAARLRDALDTIG